MTWETVWLALKALVLIGLVSAGGSLIVVGGYALVLLFMVYALPRGLDAAYATHLFVLRHRRRIAELSVAALLASGLLWYRWYFFWDTDQPDVLQMVHFAPPQVGRIYDSSGNVLVEVATTYRKPVEYREIPVTLEHAAIAAEDKNFWTHDGVDVMATIRAGIRNAFASLVGSIRQLRSGNGSLSPTIVQGGSTLTMQLVRNYYLSDWLEREDENVLLVDSGLTRWFGEHIGIPKTNRFTRKLREIKYAWSIERSLHRYLYEQECDRIRASARVEFDTPLTRRLASVFSVRLVNAFGVRWYHARLWEEAGQSMKQLILSRYLSTAYFGDGMYGAKAAAEYRFNKPLARVTVDEAALLMSFIPAPSRYGAHPTDARSRAAQLWRRNEILRRMAERRFIYDAAECRRIGRPDCRDEYALYSARPVFMVSATTRGRTEAPATVQTAMAEVQTLYRTEGALRSRSIFDGSMNIVTTTDLRLQRIVQRAARHGQEIYRTYYPDELHPPQIAIVVLRNSDGAIMAQFGGFVENVPDNWTHFDRSRRSMRQWGSTIKPLVYLAAFMTGKVTPESYVVDSPESVRMGGGWRKAINNFDGKFLGTLSFREAFARSRNIPALRVGRDIAGTENVLKVAQEIGVHSAMRNEPSTLLGASDVTLLEQTNAIRAIASNGIVAEPYVVSRIADAFGAPVWERRVETRRADIPPQALEYTQELMRSAVRLPYGTGHSLERTVPGIPLMGKTGTTNDCDDARFLGATWGPNGYTVGVWDGFDDHRSLGDEAYGGRLALPIARDVFVGMYRELGATYGPPPAMPSQIEERIDKALEAFTPKKPAK